MKMPRVIGITGAFGSGKTTAANYLAEKGYRRITLSSFLAQQLEDEEKELTRKNLQDLGDKFRQDYGPGILAKKALEYASKNNLDKIVIDGIRNVGEVELLRKSSDFVLLGLLADRDVRFNRVKNLPGREKLTRNLFDELDYRDLGITEEGENALQVAKCFAISDYFIDNNAENGYPQKLDKFLESYE